MAAAGRPKRTKEQRSAENKRYYQKHKKAILKRQRKNRSYNEDDYCQYIMNSIEESDRYHGEPEDLDDWQID